jgi:hypothetical protein
MDVREAKMRTLRATVNTVEDRIGNALSAIKLLLFDAEKSRLVNKETYEKAMILIDGALEDLRKLSSITAISEKKVFEDIYYLEIDK